VSPPATFGIEGSFPDGPVLELSLRVVPPVSCPSGSRLAAEELRVVIQLLPGEANIRAGAGKQVVVPFPVPNSDSGLVAALRANHPDAVRALCNRHSGELLQFAAGILGPDPHVDQVVRETFRRSLRRLQDLPDARELRAWLLLHLVDVAHQRLRARHRWRWLVSRPASSWPASSDHSEQLFATYRVLDRMNHKQRIVLCLVAIHSMGLTEVAAVLGVSLSVVQSRLDGAHASFLRHSQREFSGLEQRQRCCPVLGAEIAKEHASVLGDRRILAFDVLHGTLDARYGMGQFRRRPITWMLAVAPLIFVLSSAIAAVVSYFRVVKFEVHGHPPATNETGELGYLVVAPPQRSEVISFSDGSTFSLVPGGRLRVLGTTRSGGLGALESGSARLSIAGSRGTEYRVAAGPFAVSIPKGQVEVTWDPNSEQLGLVVHLGHVVISGCQFGAGVSVTSGKELGAHCVEQ
jgi:DNA-directed RNA polymerase specialized sigma24 family protein